MAEIFLIALAALGITLGLQARLLRAPARRPNRDRTTRPLRG
jgi:hypothetical protein